MFFDQWNTLNRRVHYLHRTADPNANQKKKKRRHRQDSDEVKPRRVTVYNVKVYFVDYGYSAVVLSSVIRFIDKEFLEVKNTN